MVKMLDALEENGHHYLVMDYVSGGDLKALLQNGPLSVEHILNIAIDLADALTRAHRLNIIHRDLKPANVLLAEDGTPRLTDFGVARLMSKEQITDSDAILGTIDYLAPEVFGEDTIDNRADIWAFGILLFEMLTGDVPFKGDSIIQTIMAITTQPIPDLEDLRSDVPIDLVDIVYRMLEKDRHSRIVSMRHVGSSLEDIMQGRSLDTPVETRFAAPMPFTEERQKHNLPAQTTPFVGREAELKELQRLLGKSHLRLVTILAPGGMGKTRLALESAEQQVEKFPDGVYFVELANLSDPNNMIAAIAGATGYQLQSDGREQKQQVLDFLAKKTLLLVMDNYEHLLEGAPLVTELLNAAPNLKILATSRQRLNQSGETVLNLAGMDFSEWETPDDALEYAAVKLFMLSARRIQSQFELTSENMGAVGQILNRVYGMPLGILLAATWLEMLTIEEISDEIAQGIDFLETDMSDLPKRHRSIRAVIDYSWDLLSETERNVFMKLSVFRGGFTREAAHAVTGASLPMLMNLMHKSLINRNIESGRFSIHELLRQYAEDKLNQSQQTELAWNVYTDYFGKYLKQLEADIKGRNQLATRKKIAADYENIKTAWLWASDHNLTSILLDMVESMSIYHDILGSHTTLITLLQHTIATTSFEDNRLCEGYIIAHQYRSFAAGFPPDIDTYLAKLKSIADSHDDMRLSAIMHFIKGNMSISKMRFKEAITDFKQAIELYHQTGDVYYLPACYFSTNFAYVFSGEPEKGEQLREKALRIGQASGNLASVCWPMIAHAWTLILKHEDVKQGLQLARKSLQIATEYESQIFVGLVSSNTAYFLFFEGQFDEAYRLARSANDLAIELNNDDTRGGAMRVLALLAAMESRYDDALSLAHTALQVTPEAAIGRRLGAHFAIALASCDQSNPEKLMRSIIYYLKHNFLAREWGSLHHGLIPAAFLLSNHGQCARSAQVLGLALTRRIPIPGWMQKWPPISELQKTLIDELGKNPYQSAYTLGQSLDLEIVVQEFLTEFGDEV